MKASSMLAAFFGLAVAAPKQEAGQKLLKGAHMIKPSSISLKTIDGPKLTAADCNAPVNGLSFDDCIHMNNIGMAGMGDNPGNNGFMWIGDDGPNRFRFNNVAGESLTLIMWAFQGDYSKSFMNVNRPVISWSLAPGQGVVVSVGPAISLGYASLNNRETILSDIGQIYNTWGEANTGNGGPGSATINVSRLVNMGGNSQTVHVANCVADMNFCSFQCKNGVNTCGESGTYDLINCTPDVNPDSGTGWYENNPQGGCYGWDNGGDVYVDLGH